MKSLLRILFFSLFTLTGVQAANVTFADYAASTSPAGTDYLVGYRPPMGSAAEKRFTLATLATYFSTGLQPLSSNLTALAAKTAPTGAIVGTTDTQTFTNKSMSGSANTFTLIPGSALVITGTPNGAKVLRDDFSWVALAGGGDALIANPLSQFAPTTSVQLASVLSDELGSTGGFVRGGYLGTGATLNVAASGDAASGEIVKGNDTRLTGGTLGSNSDFTFTETSSATSQDVGFSPASGKAIVTFNGVVQSTGYSFSGSVMNYTAPSNGTVIHVFGSAPAGGGGGAGDMLLGTAQTVTASKTFNDGTLKVAGATSGTVTIHTKPTAGTLNTYMPIYPSYTVTYGGLSGDHAITLPDTDFTMASTATAQTFTNKTLSGASNAFSNIPGSALVITGTPNGTKVLRDDFSWVSLAGGGDALVANPLSQFASTTSAQLAGVLSDETGTGFVVFSASPSLTGTPTAPTATLGTNTTQLATTAFVIANAGGGGGTPGGSNTNLQYNNAGAFGGAAEWGYISPTLTNTQNAAAATSAVGLALVNTTAATALVPLQVSPDFKQSEKIWNTYSNASHTVDWVWDTGYTTSPSFTASATYQLKGVSSSGQNIPFLEFNFETAFGQNRFGLPGGNITFGTVLAGGNKDSMYTNGPGGKMVLDGVYGWEVLSTYAGAGNATFTVDGQFQVPYTNTAGGTTGAQTINKISGSVNFAAAAQTLVVTNSFALTTSHIFVQVEGTDTTAKTARVTKASGSFTITLDAAATAETKVSFFVLN